MIPAEQILWESNYGDAPSTPPSTPPSALEALYDGTFQSVYNIAKGQGARYPELVAAQWQLESASGSSPSGANNFFGIKAAGGESGTVKGTWEEGSSGAYNTNASRTLNDLKILLTKLLLVGTKTTKATVEQITLALPLMPLAIYVLRDTQRTLSTQTS